MLARKKVNIVWRKVTKFSTYHPQCLIYNKIIRHEETKRLIVKEKKSIDAGPEKSQMLKLADKDLKQIL